MSVALKDDKDAVTEVNERWLIADNPSLPVVAILEGKIPVSMSTPSPGSMPDLLTDDPADNVENNVELLAEVNDEDSGLDAPFGKAVALLVKFAFLESGTGLEVIVAPAKGIPLLVESGPSISAIVTVAL